MITRKLQHSYTFESRTLSDLPISVRQYEKGRRQYEAAILEISSLVEGISTFEPLSNWLKSITSTLQAVKKKIHDTIENDSLGNIDEFMKEEGQSLESVLDSTPIIKIPDTLGRVDGKIMEDIEELSDRLIERVRSHGYDLYHYLIGASF
jgi:DNA-binding transcriptional regulator GbsR (MarR family)